MKRIAVALAVLALLGFAGSASARMTTRTYAVKGVKTTADARRIEKAVRRLPGVSRATTRRNALTVTYDSKKVTEPRMRRAVDRAGPYRMGKATKARPQVRANAVRRGAPRTQAPARR